MSSIVVQPMQWSDTPGIDEAGPVRSSDAECFKEIRDVLKKYDSLDRFGVTLIHSHFDIGEDEEMVEVTDLENRTLTTKPVKRSEIDETMVTVTNWKFTEGDVVSMRTCVCSRTDQGHSGGHTAM